MAVRPVFLAQLGEHLRGLRTARGWKQSQAADIAMRRGLTAVTYNALRYLEDGKTKHPDKELLEDAAKLYGVSYPDLVVRYVQEQYDLPVRVTKTRQRGQSGVPMGPELSKAELELVTWYRNLEPRKQEAASRLLPLFGALDATAVKHLAPHAEDSPDRDAQPHHARLRKQAVPVLRHSAR